MGIIRSGVRMSAGELGCTYASLILHDDGQEVTEDKIKALLKAADVETEAYWPGLFCRAFNDFEGGMDKLVTTPALGGGGGGPVLPQLLVVMLVVMLLLRRRSPRLKKTTWPHQLPAFSVTMVMTIKHSSCTQ